MTRSIATVTAALLLAFATTSVADDAVPSALTVQDAWARATPPGTGIAAAYLTIVGGAVPDRLVGASTGMAAMTRIHSVAQSDGMARMREADDIAISAGERIVFAPHGLHLMLMDLKQPLVAGQRFTVTLTFAHAGTREVGVDVVAPDQPPPTAHH